MALLSALARHPSGRIGAAIILVFLILAALGAIGLTPHDPLKQFVIDRLKGPSATYWFGTDLLGRDNFSRLMLGIAFDDGNLEGLDMVRVMEERLFLVVNPKSRLARRKVITLR
jgi:ABC-type antimicrobial peptide transport system permease subunit